MRTKYIKYQLFIRQTKKNLNRRIKTIQKQKLIGNKKPELKLNVLNFNSGFLYLLLT